MINMKGYEYNFEEEYRRLNPLSQLHKADAYEDAIANIIEGKLGGVECAFDSRLAFRPGEITIWGGVNGHGKSLLSGQVAMQFMRRGEKVAIMSFEMSPQRTLYRMIRQVAGRKPQLSDLQPFFKRFNDRAIVLDKEGSITPVELFGAIAVCVRDFRCTQIFIDNLAMCVDGETDFDAQKEFIKVLKQITIQLGIHVHLIHHVKKGMTEDDKLGKFSFKGSGAIVDLCDNAVIVQRNRKKEDECQKRNSSYLPPTEDEAEGDSVIRVVKQRNGDWEGTILLWFNREATSFCLTPERKTTW